MSPSAARTNLFLAGVLVLQIILLIFIPRGAASTPSTSAKDASIAGTKPFSGIDQARVRGITINGEGGKLVKLAAEVKKEGDKDVTNWTVASRDGYPARTDDCNRIVEALKKVTYSRVITRQEKRYAGLNVADGVCRARVTIEGEGGKPLADVYIGDSRDSNGVYVRVAGDPAVYQASGAAAYDFPTSISGLVDSKFLDTPLDQIASIKLINATETYEIRHEKPASVPTETKGTDSKPVEPVWMTVEAKPQTLDKAKVEALARSLGTLYMSEPVSKSIKPEFGFDKPTATAVIRTNDGKETTIKIGAERKDEKDYYAQVSGKDFVVTVGSYNVTDYFQKKLKDLLPGTTPDDGHDHDHGDEK